MPVLLLFFAAAIAVLIHHKLKRTWVKFLVGALGGFFGSMALGLVLGLILDSTGNPQRGKKVFLAFFSNSLSTSIATIIFLFIVPLVLKSKQVNSSGGDSTGEITVSSNYPECKKLSKDYGFYETSEENTDQTEKNFTCKTCGFFDYGEDPSILKWKKCIGCGNIMGEEAKIVQPVLENNTLLDSCSNCGQQFSKRAVSCPKCNHERTSECFVCKKQVPQSCKYCPFCGDPSPFEQLIV